MLLYRIGKRLETVSDDVYYKNMTSGKRLLAKVAPFARIARGVAHPHRLAILYMLAHEPMWPHDIARHIPIRESLVAHHLKEMYASGWLKKHRVGKNVMYRINKKVFRELPKFLAGTPLWDELNKQV